MAKMVEIKFDQAKLNAVRRQLAGFPRALPKVMSRAINRTATSARTKITSAIRDEVKIKLSAVRKSVRLRTASYGRWQADLAISPFRTPLIHFDAQRRKTGISYVINPKAGRKMIKSAFIQTMASGHRGVFRRRGKSRLPIVELFGPSVGAVFEETPAIAARIMAESGQDLTKNINDQVRMILDRARGAA